MPVGAKQMQICFHAEHNIGLPNSIASKKTNCRLRINSAIVKSPFIIPSDFSKPKRLKSSIKCPPNYRILEVTHDYKIKPSMTHITLSWRDALWQLRDAVPIAALSSKAIVFFHVPCPCILERLKFIT